MMASSTNGTFPRWQIAVALGATGAIGLGYWYMRRSSAPPGKPQKDQKKPTDTVKIPSDKPLTPLEQAQKHKNEGNVHFKNGKFTDAISMYNKAIEVCPKESTYDLATFYQNRAAAYENLKKWSAVKADCTTALELNPKYLKAMLRRVKACENMKDYDQALDDITSVCLVQRFQDTSSLLTADRVLKELGKKHAAEAMLARVPIVPSPFFIKTYFSSFSEDPVFNQIQGDAVLTDKVRSAFQEGRFDDIIPGCTEIIDSPEDDQSKKLDALLFRATFHLLCGSYDKAIDDLGSVINSKEASDKHKVNALIKRASLYMQTEGLEDCLRDFSVAVETNPNISDIYHHRGQINLLREKIEDASADFNKAVSLNDNFPIAYAQKCFADYRLASLMKDQQALNEAIEAFQQSLEKFPTCSECFSLYAQLLTEERQYNKADEMYDKAWKIEKNPSLLVNRGLLLLQWRADVEKTVQVFQEAIKLDPLCQFAYETLGTLEVQRGNMTEAIDLFNKASKLAKTEMEMTHIFSLRNAAASQLKMSEKLGITPQV